jgi:putative FmdB family regulatory protein
MPNYDYRCSVCGHVHELFTTMNDDKLKKCPKCNKRKAKRLIGKGNFILKGKGFYNTDYRGGNDIPPASSSSKTSPS